MFVCLLFYANFVVQWISSFSCWLMSFALVRSPVCANVFLLSNVLDFCFVWCFCLFGLDFDLIWVVFYLLFCKVMWNLAMSFAEFQLNTNISFPRTICFVMFLFVCSGLILIWMSNFYSIYKVAWNQTILFADFQLNIGISFSWTIK